MSGITADNRLEAAHVAQEALEALLQQGLPPTPEVFERFYRAAEDRRGSGSSALGRDPHAPTRSDRHPRREEVDWPRLCASSLSTLHRVLEPGGEAAKQVARAFAHLSVPGNGSLQIGEVEAALNLASLELLARERPTRVPVAEDQRLERELVRAKEENYRLDSECHEYHDLLCDVMRELARLLPPSSSLVQRLPALLAGAAAQDRDRWTLREFVRREVGWISSEIAGRREEDPS